MRKQYKKESLGRIDGSLSSGSVFTVPHSPEQEQNMQKLIEQLRPYFLQGIQQAVTIAIEENWELQEGDIIQYVVQYITNYFITEGMLYVAGNGIEILGSTISVRDGEGLDASGGDLDINLASSDPGLQISSDELDIKAGDGITTDSNGTTIDLDGTNQFDTAHRETGCGLSFSDDDSPDKKLRVKPLDFLYTSDDD